MNRKTGVVFVVALFAITVIAFTNSKTKTPELADPNLACSASNLTGRLINENLAVFNGKDLIVPALAFDQQEIAVLGITDQERWVEVDLSEQTLRAWEGDKLFLESLVSTGLPWWPTPTGEFRIWIKLRATKMEGGEGDYYYYLPNVPYVMFFGNEQVPNWKGYGLHGTYWHSDFGTQRSHGCVNLPTDIAEELYYWVTPDLGDNKWSVKSSDNNPGTRVVIHE